MAGDATALGYPDGSFDSVGMFTMLHHVPTRALDAPDQVAGMAHYGLACAQAVAGLPDAAADTLVSAIALNPDVRANAVRDPDLAALRDRDRLDGILAASPAAG